MTYHFLNLSFAGEWAHLEPEYLAFQFNASLNRVRIAILTAVFFYAGFGILDAIIAPEQKFLFWIIRYGVVCPLAIGVFAYTFFPKFEKYDQPCLFAICLLGGVGIEMMIITADPPAMYSYYAGLILVFIMIHTFIRMRFLWASACSWLIVACYEVGALWLSDTPAIILINNNFFFISANIFCSLAGYSIELNSRKRFFSNMQLENAKNEISRANLVLDQRVKERTKDLLAANERLNREIREKTEIEKSRLKLEQELNKRQKLEAIGTLAGGIAHDFNNILASVVGYAELCLETLDRGTGVYEDVQHILKAGLRGKGLTSQILTFSRQDEHDFRAVHLGQVVKETLQLLRATVPAGIDMSQQITSDAIVHGDENQLHRVVLNLCTNAYQAMEGAVDKEAKGRIEVSVEEGTCRFNHEAESAHGTDDFPEEHGDTPCVILRVTDTGQGIAREVMDRIFDPFFTTKPVDQGTGMGLSVVHGVVDQHQGKIDVESQPGKGTTFTLYFPIYTDQPDPESSPALTLPTGSGMVMLVEDEAPIIEMMIQHITALGYSVDSFTDSSRAVEVFLTSPMKYDAIFTDFNMPGLNGLELARKITAVRAGLPVILCTGYGDQINRENMETAGVIALLMKPVIKVEIAAALDSVLQKKANRDRE